MVEAFTGSMACGAPQSSWSSSAPKVACGPPVSSSMASTPMEAMSRIWVLHTSASSPAAPMEPMNMTLLSWHFLTIFGPSLLIHSS